MEYRELEVTLQSQGDRFEVVARYEPDPEVREPFVPPLDRAEVAALARRAEREAEARIGRRADLGRPAPAPAASAESSDSGKDVPSPQRLGAALFGALFTGSVGEIYRRCVLEVEAAGRDRAGLRLRLSFRYDDPALGFLTGFPWELLWDEAEGGFLGRRPERTLVRDLTAGQRVESLLVEPPLRVLIVDSGASDLALHRERRRIGRVLEEHEGFKPFGLDRPSLPEVREALEEHAIHVLHFMGHGGYEETHGAGVIWLVDRLEREQPVLGEVLAEQLLGLPDLRLVVLNTCKSGMQGADRRDAGRGASPSTTGATP